MSGTPKLLPTYGKQNVPVFKVVKQADGTHGVIDMIVDITLSGDVAKSWLSGDNSQIVPTETQKNTCYALALQTDFDAIEDYAVALASDILKRHSHIAAVKVEVRERPWLRVDVSGPHKHAFTCPHAPWLYTCCADVTRSGAQVRAGVRDLKLLKTTKSGFEGFIRDKYTNLQAVGSGAKSASPDRMFSTELVAEWSYSGRPDVGYKQAREAIKDLLVTNFSGPAPDGTFSKSLQETTYKMATAVLDTFRTVDAVSLTAPNIHFYPFAAAQFGLDNPNVVFQSTDPATTASGKIRTVLTRDAHRSRL